ncbi:MAG: hypothetical protein ACK5BO_10475 [Bacteroidota bacterium]|jgi:hypothetical protein
MKKIFTLSLLVACSFSNLSYAQGFMADAVNPGRVYRELKFDNIVGSALLFEDWHKARVKLSQGKLITGLMVNFDVYGHKALYLNNEAPFEFVDQLDYIETDFDNPSERRLFMSGFISNQFSPTTFIQVLNDGALRLLKYNRKVLVDNKTYGSSNNDNKTIELQSYYFIGNNKAAAPVKLSKSTLEELAGNKKAELMAYVNTNDLNAKKEADFAKALDYLNGLNK